MGRLSLPTLLPMLLMASLGPALAQPAVNNSALDALQPAPPRPRPVRPAPTTTPAPKPQAAKPPARSDAARPTPRPTAPALPRPPTVPIAPPAIAAIPPVVAVPVQRPPDPPAVPVAADAPGVASPVPGGVRATFGPDRTELNTVTEAALRSFARPLRSTEQPINVLAYAAGHAEDPSTPRRLSLARALAARAVLINEGIPSTRIYVRALGPATNDGPPDRVDVSVSVPGAEGPRS